MAEIVPEADIAPAAAVPDLSDRSVVERLVREYFSDVPVMAEIASCESRFRHLAKDGSVLRGAVTPKDVGVMQINEYYHLKASQKLGLNIHTFEDNLRYARYLFEREGTTPWLSSSKCWGIHRHISRN